MTFKVIRGQGQGQEMNTVPYRDYFWMKMPVIFSDISFQTSNYRNRKHRRIAA